MDTRVFETGCTSGLRPWVLRCFMYRLVKTGQSIMCGSLERPGSFPHDEKEMIHTKWAWQWTWVAWLNHNYCGPHLASHLDGNDTGGYGENTSRGIMHDKWLVSTSYSSWHLDLKFRPHQIQCPGCPEHPSQPPGLPEISDWEPEGLSWNSQKIKRNFRKCQYYSTETSFLGLWALF